MGVNLPNRPWVHREKARGLGLSGSVPAQHAPRCGTRASNSSSLCDATVTEFLAGEPVKDENKRKRFREFWQGFISQLPSFPLDRDVCERAGALLLLARTKGKTVPLADAYHGAVAELEGLTVWTADTDHFREMGVVAINPLL